MNTTINDKLKKVLDLMNEMDADQRVAVFNEFSDEWLMNLGLTKIEPLSMDEYNTKLEEGLTDYKNNNVISHSDMKTQVQEWKRETISLVNKCKK